MNLPRVFHSLRIAIAFLAISGFETSLLLAANAKKSAPVPVSPDPTAVEFLLASAIKEFRSSGTSRPTAIRNARVGFFYDSGTSNYVLCGSFKSDSSATAKWTAFATIKTSDYEHWLGGAAQAFCRQKNIKWYPGNYSATLMQRLEN
jgi:hypothetical protein